MKRGVQIDRKAVLIRKTRQACGALLRATMPCGLLHDNPYRTEVSSRCKWLLMALDRAEGLEVPEPEAEPDEDEQAEIEARIAETRDRKTKGNR